MQSCCMLNCLCASDIDLSGHWAKNRKPKAPSHRVSFRHQPLKVRGPKKLFHLELKIGDGLKIMAISMGETLKNYNQPWAMVINVCVCGICGSKWTFPAFCFEQPWGTWERRHWRETAWPRQVERRPKQAWHSQPSRFTWVTVDQIGTA